jgi:hypothetical protein
MALSHTRIRAFDECPLLYRGTYIDKIEKVKAYPLLAGGFFARWTEIYLGHLLSTQKHSDMEEGLQLFEKLWKERAADKEFKVVPEPAYYDIQPIVSSFLENRSYDPNTMLEPETQIALDINWQPVTWFSKQAFFRAKIDLPLVVASAPKTVEIIDFKTNYNAASMEDTENDPQLRRYVVAMHSTMPDTEKYRVTLDFVRSNIKRTVELDPAVAEVEKDRIMGTSDRVQKCLESGTWEATPGSACAFCPMFEKKCPAKNLIQSELRAPDDLNQAENQMKILIMMSKKIKDLQGGLKLYTDLHGPVHANGMQYGPFPEHSYSWEIKQLIAWARKYEVSPEKVTRSVDNTTMNRILKKIPDELREEAKGELRAFQTDKGKTPNKLKKWTDPEGK